MTVGGGMTPEVGYVRRGPTTRSNVRLGSSDNYRRRFMGKAWEHQRRADSWTGLIGKPLLAKRDRHDHFYVEPSQNIAKMGRRSDWRPWTANRPISRVSKSGGFKIRYCIHTIFRVYSSRIHWDIRRRIQAKSFYYISLGVLFSRREERKRENIGIKISGR